MTIAPTPPTPPAPRRAPPPRPPVWVRAVLAADGLAQGVARLASAARDEIFFAWLSPAQRDRLNESIYATRIEYLPHGRVNRAGLFDWERAAVTRSPFPPRGRILVGGAGSGREPLGLHALGYEAVGFDPSEEMVRNGQADVAAAPGVTLVPGSYADLVAAAAGARNRLAPYVVGQHFDGVILGWSSLSYLMSDEERIELLRAVRRLAPAAPVLLSFVLYEHDELSSVRAKARGALRGLFARLGAPSRYRPGYVYMPWTGLLQLLRPADIESLAAATGYSVAHLTTDPHPHAVLVPA